MIHYHRQVIEYLVHQKLSKSKLMNKHINYIYLTKWCMLLSMYIKKKLRTTNQIFCTTNHQITGQKP